MNIEFNSWQDILKLVIMAIIALGGAPVTQLIKNLFSAWFKIVIEDRAAIVLTGLVAGGFAALEMWVSGLLNFSNITLDSFPETFFAVFSLATLYYGWLKGSEGFFGRKALLKEM